jgi:hypothetical protein
MSLLEVFHDGNHIKGLRVSYYDGMYDLNSDKIYQHKPLHGAGDEGLTKV